MMMDGWVGMGGYSLTHWIWFVGVIIVVLYPIGRILGRLGFSPFLALLALVPLVNFISLWILAFVDWPQDRTRSS
jgi:hypothetical protein